MMSLADRVAIITGGGGRGCGRALAERFASEGAAVIVADVNQASAAETAAALQSAGRLAVSFGVDVGNDVEVRRLFAFAQETFGGVDIVVNNASAMVFPETSFDDALANLRVDLLGAIAVTRHGIEALRHRGGGAIVHISSTSALAHGDPREHGPSSTGYNTAKAAILRFTTTLASMGRAENIRVNCLVPHWIGTEHIKAEVARMTDVERRQWNVPDVLIGPEELADATLHLATDERLAGRVLVWYGGQPPRLIPFGDRGYVTLEDWVGPEDRAPRQ
jgi:NAD(P)-dependent dehydrogenase (short-subunit alcohol dehydrogenase family)